MISVEEGFEWAHAAGNDHLDAMRKGTSPLGRYVVRALKKRGPEYQEILEQKAIRKFGMGCKDLSPYNKRAVSNWPINFH